MFSSTTPAKPEEAEVALESGPKIAGACRETSRAHEGNAHAAARNESAWPHGWAFVAEARHDSAVPRSEPGTVTGKTTRVFLLPELRGKHSMASG